jgi:hypothetical protein
MVDRSETQNGMNNPVEKYQIPVWKKAVYLGIPAGLALLWCLYSLCVDLRNPACSMFSRSGSILVGAGAWLGYHEARWSFVYDQGALYFNPDPSIKKYVIVSFIFAILGTIIWGYGDLLLRYFVQ